MTEHIHKHSKGDLLLLAKHLGSVSAACRTMGYSRDSFYRYKAIYESDGPAALDAISRRKPLLKNRVAPDVERAVVRMAHEQPSWGQARVSGELKARGICVSPAGVRCVWLRHGLATSGHRLLARAREERTLDDEAVTRNESVCGG